MQLNDSVTFAGDSDGDICPVSVLGTENVVLASH